MRVLLPDVVVLLSHSSIRLSNWTAPEDVGRQPNATDAWENKQRTRTLSKWGENTAVNYVVLWDPTISASQSHTTGAKELKLRLLVKSLSLYGPEGPQGYTSGSSVSTFFFIDKKIIRSHDIVHTGPGHLIFKLPGQTTRGVCKVSTCVFKCSILDTCHSTMWCLISVK